MNTQKTSKSSRPINEEKVAARHAESVLKEKDVRKKLKRMFNAWVKVDQAIDRDEKLLEKASAQKAAAVAEARRQRRRKPPKPDEILDDSAQL